MTALVLALIQYRNAMAGKAIDCKRAGFIEPEVPVKITASPVDLTVSVPRKPASAAGESYVTVVRHGSASLTATIHGALELKNPPFEIRLDTVRPARSKWHKVEPPSSLGGVEPALIGHLWPSKQPMYDRYYATGTE